MFRIKICGITNLDDAQHALSAGADALGLNFYAKSPRYIEISTARAIAQKRNTQAPSAKLVGVFVNASAAEICDLRGQAQLDLIQLSGDEPPSLLAELAQLGVPPSTIVRALRVPPGGEAAARRYLDECRRLECLPGMILWDAYDATQFGGTGRVADWDLAAQWVEDGTTPPLALAGGLKPDNVRKAIRAVRPAAVDTASGVESAPGRKDADAVRRFVAEARAAFDNSLPRD
jgi:phosphoribosylanthranilate isomerase